METQGVLTGVTVETQVGWKRNIQRYVSQSPFSHSKRFNNYFRPWLRQLSDLSKRYKQMLILWIQVVSTDQEVKEARQEETQEVKDEDQTVEASQPNQKVTQVNPAANTGLWMKMVLTLLRISIPCNVWLFSGEGYGCPGQADKENGYWESGGRKNAFI